MDNLILGLQIYLLFAIAFLIYYNAMIKFMAASLAEIAVARLIDQQQFKERVQKVELEIPNHFKHNIKLFRFYLTIFIIPFYIKLY